MIRLPVGVAALTLMLSAPAFAQSVPGSKRDLAFDEMMKTLDLDDPALTLTFKAATKDGSSIGFLIGRGEEKPSASFVPTNTSSIPEAEVVSYRLARFLGVSRIYYPVDYYKLGPKARDAFVEMVRNAREFEEDRVINLKMVKRELKDESGSLLGIYRRKPKTKLYPARSLGAQGEFYARSDLGQMIRGTGPIPTDDKVELEGVKGGGPEFPTPPAEHQVELARQLSTIFVIDQLLGQWDRFWANLEAAGDKNGRLKLVARDNGGASISDWEGFDAYSRWVSRYDRDVIEKLTKLNTFLKLEAQEFAGFSNVDAWKEAVGFLAPESFAMFKKKLALFIDTRLPALEKQCGEGMFFAEKAPDVAALDAADTGEED